MRWNRSRWVPRAWATAALIGSAWETATIVSPGWRGTQLVEGADDAGLHLGEGLAVREPERRSGSAAPCCHSGSFMRSFSSAPVQSPKSHSSRPRSICTFRPRAAAIGAAVSRVRSSGEA